MPRQTSGRRRAPLRSAYRKKAANWIRALYLVSIARPPTAPSSAQSRVRPPRSARWNSQIEAAIDQSCAVLWL